MPNMTNDGNPIEIVAGYPFSDYELEVFISFKLQKSAICMCKSFWKPVSNLSNKNNMFGLAPDVCRKLRYEGFPPIGGTNTLAPWNLEIMIWATEKKTGCLGLIGDEILPRYIGIIINHEIRIPIKQPLKLENKGPRVFFRASFDDLHVSGIWSFPLKKSLWFEVSMQHFHPQKHQLLLYQSSHVWGSGHHVCRPMPLPRLKICTKKVVG